jgi:hypothetical protein
VLNPFEQESSMSRGVEGSCEFFSSDLIVPITLRILRPMPSSGSVIKSDS